MIDTLLGAIIGGLITSVTPIVMLIIDHRRWQRQATLEQLRFERKRLEKIFSGNLKRFSQAIAENGYTNYMQPYFSNSEMDARYSVNRKLIYNHNL